MTKTSTVKTAAQSLLSAYNTGVCCEPIRSLLADDDTPSNLSAAYAIQDANTNHWLNQGRRLVGCKIGLTSTAAQQQLGVDQPVYGMLFADMCRADGATISINDVLQPKIETGIALVLESDLTVECPTVVDIISATAYALPVLEIIGSRISHWDITITDTIADNASSGLFVLGQQPRKLNEFDPRLCGMVTERKGQQVSVGAGIACLGSPLNAVVWLANTMVQHHHSLQAGDIILSGALGPMVNVSPGDVFTARISGLGSVKACFSNA